MSTPAAEDEDMEADHEVAEREEKEAGETAPRRGRPRLADALRSSDEEGAELPPLLDRTRLESDFNNRNAFDFPGRPLVDLDKEINQRNVLYGTVSKYRHSDDAQVTIERVLPETWEGVNTKGFTDRYHVNTFQTADDLLEIIKRTSGGYQYTCVFTAPNKAGEPKTIARCRVHINAPPIVQSTPMGQGTKQNGHSSAPNPSMEMVDRVLKTQSDIIAQQKKEAEDPRMIAQMANMMREMRASNEAAMNAIMKIQQDQVTNLMKQAEHSGKPDTGLIKFTSEQAVAERDRLQSRFDMEKTQLIAIHQQQMDSVKRDAQQQVDFIRRDKESEIARMTAQMTALENQNAMIKLSLETNFNTQLNNMRTTYENQIANMKSASDLNLNLNMNRIQVLEAQVKMLEEQRSTLLQEKIADAKNRPDSLSAMAGTMAAVKELAAGMGFAKDSGSSEPEFVSTIKALKDIGIGDTLGRIADRFAPRPPGPPPGLPPGMQPLGVYNVPVNAQGIPLVPPPGFAPPQPPMPLPPPMATQQRPPVPLQTPQVNLDGMSSPAPQQRAASAPNPQPPSPPSDSTPLQELPNFDPDTLKPVAGLFEMAMNGNWPIEQFAAEVVKDIPRPVLITVLNAGSVAFLEAVQKVAPETDLTSVKGTEWLKKVFDLVGKILQNTPPPA